MTGSAETPALARRDDTNELLVEIDELRATVRVLQERVTELETGKRHGDEAEEKLRQSEQEVREARERLAHVTRLSTLGEMATGIAHEINQPLAAVATYAQACGRMIRSRTTDDVELLETLGRISDEALRAGAIINKLKDLVRRRNSGQVPCDLNALVADVALLAGVDAQHNGVELRLELSDGPTAVIADPVQIQQVVLNLARNGLEAIVEAGWGDPPLLILRTHAAVAGQVRVSVVDCGVGLDESADEAVFAPFYTTKESGMGMGLSISRTILRAHGGKIWFERNPTGGMTFRFSLPAEEGDAHGD